MADGFSGEAVLVCPPLIVKEGDILKIVAVLKESLNQLI